MQDSPYDTSPALPRQAQYATFECSAVTGSSLILEASAQAPESACGSEFVDRLTPLYEDLPLCPSCGGSSVLLGLLGPADG